MSDQKHVKQLRAIRHLLNGYGVEKNESIHDAVARLIREHQEARDLAVETLADNEQLKREAELARRTRDSAQALATQAVNEKRAAEEDRRAVRRALDVLLPLIPEPERTTIPLVADGPRMARCFLAGNAAYEFHKEGAEGVGQGGVVAECREPLPEGGCCSSGDREPRGASAAGVSVACLEAKPKLHGARSSVE